MRFKTTGILVFRSIKNPLYEKKENPGKINPGIMIHKFMRW